MKVLGFIATEGSGSTEPVDPCLSHLPEILSKVSVRPIVYPHFLGRYLNACNAIDNHNKTQQYDIALDKYRVTQSDYFRLATTVTLGIGITDGNILYFRGVSEGNVDLL